MKESKKKLIMFIVLFIVSCLMYSVFLSGYFSIDAGKIVNLGYDGYALNYSFYDGRIVMGIICMIAHIMKINIKVFTIALLLMAIIVSDITVLKILEMIRNKKKEKSKFQYIILIMIVFLFVFNFMTIDNMQFAESFIMALSVWFYVKATEEIVFKQNYTKGILYSFIGILCYQGTINMLFLLITIFYIIENKKIDKALLKKVSISIGIVIIATILSVLLKKVMESMIHSFQSERIDFDILKNIYNAINSFPYLIIDSIELFPKGAYITFSIATLVIAYVDSIKHKKVINFYLIILVFILAIIFCCLMLALYNGIWTGNGRIFGSIGASFSALWLVLYVKTDILEANNKLKYVSNIIIISFLILNIANILKITYLYKKANLIDEELAKKIEKEVVLYENSSDNRIKYIAVKYKNNETDENKYNRRTVLKSKKYLGLFSKDELKLYTKLNFNIERIFFEKEIEEKYFKDVEYTKGEIIECIEDTVYVFI